MKCSRTPNCAAKTSERVGPFLRLRSCSQSLDAYCAPFHSSIFSDKYINVGWGSKATQFHGSVGKTAQQIPTTQSVSTEKTSSSPDDDHAPRISWRGDGAHFAVSSLDLSSPSSSTTATRRVVRTYSRQAELQSTSEPVIGLEHQLAWRPSGELIASTQRFGTFEGAGEGREGRHDVVFFERNGLRHGEFELREGGGKVAETLGQEVDGCLSWGWDYRVQELCWNADSSLLAVWLRRDKKAGDVGTSRLCFQAYLSAADRLLFLASYQCKSGPATTTTGTSSRRSRLSRTSTRSSSPSRGTPRSRWSSPSSPKVSIQNLRVIGVLY